MFKNKFTSNVIWYATLALALVLSDIAWGHFAKSVVSSVRRGDALASYNLSPIAECEVQILGASRAYINYRPEVLGPDCFNAGQNGQGVLMARILFSLSVQRKGTVIFDPSFFEEEMDRVSAAHHLYGQNPTVDEIIRFSGPKEELKLRSSFYKYSSKIGPALANFSRPPLDWRERVGNMAINPTFLPSAMPLRNAIPPGWWWTHVDALLADVKARGLRPVVVISPCARSEYNEFYDLVVLRLSPKVKTVDGRNWLPADGRFFSDAVHLNPTGAKIFSERLRIELSFEKN